MKKREIVAPSYAELRPVKGTGPRFPVYDDLVGRLLRVERGQYDTTAAHVCSVASGWAYADGETLAMMLARLGLDANRCAYLSIYNDAMFVASNVFVVQSACGRVAIVCYRGTEPRNFINWLTDGDVNPVKLPFPLGAEPDPEIAVHGGFFRNLRATWYQVAGALDRAGKGRSILVDTGHEQDRAIRPLEALYVTGHSLGAAMAALAAVRLATDRDYECFGDKLRGVYTFGQPIVGNEQFATACEANDFLRTAVFRHVYRKDIVPRLPPALTGPFRHFGPERRVDGDGRWAACEETSAQVSELLVNTLLVPALAFVSEQIAWTRGLHFPSSWYDHSPTFYIEASTPPDVGSEFERATPR